MAAPKKWGYTRELPFGPEMLVAWADGDLTEILVVEVEERLLAHSSERREVAAWARASYDSSIPHGKDRLVGPRPGLLRTLTEMIGS